MKTFNKALISTVAALLASQTEAKGIHNSCLRMSDTTAGDETGEFFTNEDQLTSTAVTDEMRLHSITTCHDDGDVYGLQFHMAMNPYEAVGEEVYDMAPIGVMSKGVCDVLELPEGLTRIKVNLQSAEAGLDIQYKIADGVLKETYGQIEADNFETWKFTAENPLIGLYGRQTEAGISQLGFVTLDTACQLALEEVVEPVEPEQPTDPVVGPEPVEPEVTVPEEEDSTVLFGLDTLTFSLIVVGIVVFIALIVTSLCTLKYKKNQHNRVASPVVSATTPVRKRDTAQSKELRPVAETDIENNGTPAISAFPHESSEQKLNKNNGNDF